MREERKGWSWKRAFFANLNHNRVLKCDVIKVKFLKLWDLSGYFERTMSRGLLAKNEHFGANCLWDRSPVILRKLHTNPSKFFWVDPKKFHFYDVITLVLYSNCNWDRRSQLLFEEITQLLLIFSHVSSFILNGDDDRWSVEILMHETIKIGNSKERSWLRMSFVRGAIYGQLGS